MLSQRLPQALESELFVLPDDGEILVFAPGSETDLSAFPKDRVRVVEEFRPDHDHWARQGYDVSAVAEGPAVAALIVMPRSKTLARALLARAAALTDGPIVVDGQKNQGIDSFYKACRKLAGVSEAIARAHGKLFVMLPAVERANTFAGWTGQMTEGPEGFVTAPGVFSEGKTDRGSELLASVLPENPGRRIADLGAGWGWLSARVLNSAAPEELHLVEASQTALDCARESIKDPRAVFHWADARSFALPGPVDTVITNPPFHTGRAAEPSLGQAFIRNAAKMLTGKGTLYLVANRGLPYETTLAEHFRKVDQIAADHGFKVLRASGPVSDPKTGGAKTRTRR